MSIVTLADQKQYMEVDYSTHDDLIQAIIDGAQNYLAQYLNVTFGTTAVAAERHDGGFKQLWLEVLPVQSVASVTDSWLETDIDSTDLLNDDRSVFLRYGSRFDEGDYRFTVAYSGGYADGEEPEALKTAVMMLAARAYANKSGASASGSNGFSTDWQKFIESDVLQLVSPHSYRRVLS